MRKVNEDRREMMRPLTLHINKAVNLPFNDLLTKTLEMYISIIVQKVGVKEGWYLAVLGLYSQTLIVSF